MVITYATYVGNVTAFLAVVKICPPFTTLEELANQDEYMFDALGGTPLQMTL